MPSLIDDLLDHLTLAWPTCQDHPDHPLVCPRCDIHTTLTTRDLWGLDGVLRRQGVRARGWSGPDTEFGQCPSCGPCWRKCLSCEVQEPPRGAPRHLTPWLRKLSCPLELPAQAWRAAAVYVEYRLWPLKLAMHPFGWEWQYGHAQEPPYLLIKPEPWVRSLLEIAMRHWSRAHPVEDAKDLDRSAWFAWLEEVCRRKGLPWVWYGRPGLE